MWRRVWDSNPRAQRANGFQDRLVMTTSISLRKGIQFQSLEKILEKTLERMMRRRRKILKVKEIQGFFEVCFRYDKKFSRPPRYDRFDIPPDDCKLFYKLLINQCKYYYTIMLLICQYSF